MNKRIQLAIAVLAAFSMMTGTIHAQSSQRKESERRQKTNNDWRNIAIASGALSLLGLLKDDKTLFFGGAIGALYSAHRYEQDRKSQNRLDRTRASYFSRPYFVRDGVRYNRQVVWKGGKKYYCFAKESKGRGKGKGHDRDDD